MGELRPQPPVSVDELLPGLIRIDRVVEQATALGIEQASGDVLGAGLQIVAAHGVAQLRVALSRLGIDEIRHQRACIATKKQVGKRHVSPEDAVEMQPRQQHDRCIQQPVAQHGGRGCVKQVLVRQREVQIASDQHRVQLCAVTSRAAADDADRPHRGQPLVLEVAQHPVFVGGEPMRQLFQRVDPLVIADHAHDMSALPPADIDEAIRDAIPLFEGMLPR